MMVVIVVEVAWHGLVGVEVEVAVVLSLTWPGHVRGHCHWSTWWSLSSRRCGGCHCLRRGRALGLSLMSSTWRGGGQRCCGRGVVVILLVGVNIVVDVGVVIQAMGYS